MRLRTVLRTWAAALLLAGWLVLLGGLWLTPPTTQPELDLEAGPAFGTTFEVYLPALGLTLLLLVLLPVGTMARRAGAGVLATAAVLCATFALWVLSREALLAYLPGLEALTWLTAALSAVALVVAGAAQVSRDDGPSAVTSTSPATA